MENIASEAPEIMAPSRFLGLATMFTNLFLNRRHPSSWLSADENKVLFDIVSAAGFEPQSLVLGKIMMRLPDVWQDCENRIQPINKLCPYKVIVGGLNDCSATRWLDELVCLAWNLFINHKGNPSTSIPPEIAKTIDRSIPMEPIQLTVTGDMLEEYPAEDRGIYTGHSRDHEKFSGAIGVHGRFCRGFIDVRQTTSTHQALFCRVCGMRKTFPLEIKTYGGFREFFRLQIEGAKWPDP